MVRKPHDPRRGWEQGGDFLLEPDQKFREIPNDLFLAVVGMIRLEEPVDLAGSLTIDFDLRTWGARHMPRSRWCNSRRQTKAAEDRGHRHRTARRVDDHRVEWTEVLRLEVALRDGCADDSRLHQDPALEFL